MNHHNNHAGLKRGLLIALCIVLSLILILLLGVTAILLKWDSYKDLMTYVDTDSVTDDPLYRQMLEEGKLLETDDQIINILLIGQDAREGEDRQRSDAMILCTVNLHTKTLTMTSFMRDMYVEIPGYSSNRLNACYQMGGMELLNKCFLVNFGIVVDGNIEVDFNSFIHVIDTLGGVDMELTQAEADYLNAKGNWGVGESTAGQWDLQAGMNHLTGEQALAYSRIRYIGNADFGRTERQRKVLTELLSILKKKSIFELDALMQDILPYVTTDIDSNQMDRYILNVLPIFNSLEVNQLRIPEDGAYYDDTINGMSVLVPDLEKNREILEEMLLG